MSRATTLAFLFAAACGGPHTISIQVQVPDLAGRETPLPGLLVTALPFDRDSVLTLLERRAGGPRPHTRELDSLFQAFQGPFLAFARTAWQIDQTSRLRDSLERQRTEASSAAARGELASRVAAIEDSLRRLEPELERRRATLAVARDTLWPRIEQLREAVERWEVTAHSGYDSVVRLITRERFRDGLADTTNARGWVRMVLPAGRWWIIARSPDPENPNAQWYWNLPAEGDTLRLSPSNARHLPRY